jgi:hypothetical protein
MLKSCRRDSIRVRGSEGRFRRVCISGRKNASGLRRFTPTSASWLNLVERWFGLPTEKQLRRGIFRSTRNLETTIRNYIDIHNEEPKPFIWTKTAGEILASVARFCQRTLETGH